MELPRPGRFDGDWLYCHQQQLSRTRNHAIATACCLNPCRRSSMPGCKSHCWRLHYYFRGTDRKGHNSRPRWPHHEPSGGYQCFGVEGGAGVRHVGQPTLGELADAGCNPVFALHGLPSPAPGSYPHTGMYRSSRKARVGSVQFRCCMAQGCMLEYAYLPGATGCPPSSFFGAVDLQSQGGRPSSLHDDALGNLKSQRASLSGPYHLWF